MMHDVARHHVTGPIRINPGTLIEQLYGNLSRVHDDYWLASCIEVDEITCETISETGKMKIRDGELTVLLLPVCELEPLPSCLHFKKISDDWVTTRSWR